MSLEGSQRTKNIRASVRGRLATPRMFVVTLNFTQVERTHVYIAVNTTPGTML